MEANLDQDHGAGVTLNADFHYCTRTYMTDVCDQGQTGACTIFAVCAEIGALYAFCGGEQAINFSKQEMIDCIRRPPGAEGFKRRHVYDYVKENGLHMEADYPFHGLPAGNCRCDILAMRPKVTIRRWRYLITGDKVFDYLEMHPITARIKLYDSFIDLIGLPAGDGMVYRTEPNEVQDPTPHAVLVVGYGRHNGEVFFIIKNSWGLGWGVNGYCRVYYNLLTHFTTAVDLNRPIPNLN